MPTRILSLAGAAAAVLLAHPVQAHDVLIHLHKTGDTLSIRNAPITIDRQVLLQELEFPRSQLDLALESGGEHDIVTRGRRIDRLAQGAFGIIDRKSVV